MASGTDYLAAAASLAALENDLRVVNSNIQVLNGNINNVDNRVQLVKNDLQRLTQDFQQFVFNQNRVNRLQIAETRVVKYRQELENRFGHNEVVRKTTIGILQADDLGIVRKETIQTATEELMIATPQYWLAPCLVALSAWINDQPPLAQRALKEAIKRNDEKTSLLFALICRRAGRKQSCMIWVERYLANQDEEKLDRKAVILLDAFVSGLLGPDSEGLVLEKLQSWLSRLSAKPGFVERQTRQWFEAIKMKRQPYGAENYAYLSKYSKNWEQLEDVLEGAYLHGTLLSYFNSIFEKKIVTGELKEQLDTILTDLVTDFDDEELPLRKKEKLEELVLKYNGDEQRAQKDMVQENKAFALQKSFTQLLTDAAMKPETAHASAATQKFALALSKSWITDAYNDVVAENRMHIPNEITIAFDNFSGVTTDGSNETELLQSFTGLVAQEREAALAQLVLTALDKFFLYGGIAVGVIGLVMALSGSIFMGLLAIVISAFLVLNYNNKKNNLAKQRAATEEQFVKLHAQGSEVIRACLAEVVDLRHEFANKDQESKLVQDFLERITPDQYMQKLTDASRRLKLS